MDRIVLKTMDNIIINNNLNVKCPHCNKEIISTLRPSGFSKTGNTTVRIYKFKCNTCNVESSISLRFDSFIEILNEHSDDIYNKVFMQSKEYKTTWVPAT